MEQIHVIDPPDSSLDEIRSLRTWIRSDPPLDAVGPALARLRSIEGAAVDALSELLAYYLEATGADIDDELPLDLISVDDIID